MIQPLLIVIFISTFRVRASGITEHLDKYLGNPKYGYSRNMIFSMGYDNIHDSRFVEQEKIGAHYKDLVDRDFARLNLLEPRITSSSDAVNIENIIKPIHPFSTAQKSLTSQGVNGDRWDVKVNDRGYQFFGLYHGNDTFVTNRMRAHVLLWLINGAKDYLTILDDLSLTEERNKLEKELMDKIKCIVERLAKRIKEDKFLTGEFEFGDYISPVFIGCSFVCVTQNYLLISLMGDSNVLLYDENSNRLNLVKQHESELIFPYFLAENYQIGSPFVSLLPRNYIDSLGERRVKYVILESGSIRKLMTDEMIDKLVGYAHLNFNGESIFTRTLVEDVIQKAEQNWLAQNTDLKSRTQDISLIVAELKN